ncbi:hypothetical protein AURDEDRAFT_67179 [Auricularia subglabra TFB-10046 SS5]|nr:hypothetical protein AURDEDRAFT_67179 [Auricularia subglabra TFB-10046 SS5]
MLFALLDAEDSDDDDDESDGSGSDESDQASSDSGDDMPDLLDNDDDEDDELLIEALFPSASDEVFAALATIVSQRYLSSRGSITKPIQPTLDFVLTVSRRERPDIFRSYFRVDPETFDDLLTSIEDNNAFQNDTERVQIPLDKQLAVTLYRMGHYGNGASLLKLMILSGLGIGTLQLVTRRVQYALSTDEFRKACVHLPDDEEKEEAKAEIERLSCAEWRNGHLLVDGTLAVFYSKPGHFGVSWYDRKSNYSTNVQIISTPDCKIRDFGVGLPGSVHDATAWKATWTYENSASIFQPGEFIWADSAYPLQSWLCAPYKKNSSDTPRPERDEPENARFNYHVSRVRVRSEHCIGYLKGRFQSLRGLRLRVDKQADVLRLDSWIIACICVHNFALTREHSEDFHLDKFFEKGERIMRRDRRERARLLREREEQAAAEEAVRGQRRDEELARGRALREHLKARIREAHEW